MLMKCLYAQRFPDCAPSFSSYLETLCTSVVESLRVAGIYGLMRCSGVPTVKVEESFTLITLIQLFQGLHQHFYFLFDACAQESLHSANIIPVHTF